MGWRKMLAYITGTVEQEFLLRNEYLVAGNRVLRSQIKVRLRLTDPERHTLAEIGKRLGGKALEEVAQIVNPETILGWHRKLIARKFDGSKIRRFPGHPRTSKEVEDLVLRFARENRSWGFDRTAGALANLGHTLSDQTAGNILKRHGLTPALEGKKGTTWREFIRTHMDVPAATDFFTAAVWTPKGLLTYYVLFFIQLASRRVQVAGITPYPAEAWMKQVARNLTDTDDGFLRGMRYLLHDREAKYSAAFLTVLENAGAKPLALPVHSPNLNAISERWVRSVKEKCLGQLILFGERSLRHALEHFSDHYHGVRTPPGVWESNPLPHRRPSRRGFHRSH